MNCPERDYLSEKVQRHLANLAELAKLEQEIMKTQDMKRADEVDRDIEHELGLKEQAMGVWRAHREQHGC